MTIVKHKTTYFIIICLQRYLIIEEANRPTICVTGGWGEKGLKTENCQSAETTPKNAPSPSRPVHAVLGGAFIGEPLLFIE
jgi:hypothetical protein